MKSRLLTFFLLAVSLSAHALSVPWLVVRDTINPGTGDYILRNLERAATEKAPLLVLELDTPGGLLSTTRQIIQAMLNAPFPVVVFIGPQGAQAGSAGALITFAADVAVMAPGSNIGAAHPVTGGGEKENETMKEKITNDTAAFAESLARAKKRNTEWAIASVKKSASIPAEEALKTNVIDFIAKDRAELTEKLSQFSLRVAKNGVTALPEGISAQVIEPSLKQRLVSFFANPSLAYLIMTLGGLCLWIELSHPGLIFPGVLGALCLIVSLISFQMLPIDYGALLLLLGGLALVVAELYLPTFGILGVGGITCFVLGSLFLVDSSVPEFRISLSLILPTAAVLAASALGLSYLILKSRRARKFNGMDAFIGEFGEARDPINDKSGRVFIHGELWNAVTTSGSEIPLGTVVEVKAVKDMTLVVAPSTTS